MGERARGEEMKQAHTATFRGKRVYVRLRSGERFVDKFLDRTDRAVQFEQKGWINKGEIKAFSLKLAKGGRRWG